MAHTQQSRTKPHISADVALAGILALLADEREARLKDGQAEVRTEVLLSKAGLSGPEIQAVTGKSPDAVKKAIQKGRAKKPTKRGQSK